MSETVFQQTNNIYPDYSYDMDALPSEATWNEMNQLPTTSIEQQTGKDGMLRAAPPTESTPISGSVIPLLVLVAGLFMLKYINRIRRGRPSNISDGN